MAAPLSNCTVVEQRAVILFLWREGVKTSKIYRRILAQYGKLWMAQKGFLLTIIGIRIPQQLPFKQ
jgi:hypothetical protein